jgi:dihydrofolate reductase
MKNISLILACTVDGGISYENDIPWYIPADLKKFKKITTTCKDTSKINAVIMGRNTWESLNKPLKNRINIIITKNLYYKPYVPSMYDNTSVLVFHNLISALIFCENDYIENIYVIGGCQLYNMFLSQQMYLNMVDKVYMSILFYDSDIKTDKYIDMNKIFINFNVEKDKDYKKETDERQFASFICTPK